MAFNYVSEGSSTTALANNYAQLYAASHAAEAITFNNLAVAGTNLADMVARAGDVDALYDGGKTNILSVQPLRNNLGGLSDGQCDTLLATLASYLDARLAVGWYVIVTTDCNRSDSDSAAYDGDRNYCNPIMRTWVGSHCNAIADFAANATIGADGRFQNSLISADGIHPTALTYGVMEEILRERINRLHVTARRGLWKGAM